MEEEWEESKVVLEVLVVRGEGRGKEEEGQKRVGGNRWREEEGSTQILSTGTYAYFLSYAKLSRTM